MKLEDEVVKRCPKCGVPMIEEGTSFSRAWVCIICGEMLIEPKGGEVNGEANRGDYSIHDGDSG